MNFRLTGIFFGLVLLLVGGLLVSLLLDGGDTAAAPDGLLTPLTRAGVKAGDIDSVEIVRTQPGEEKLLFVKSGERWELQKPGPAKVDGFALDGLVRELFRAAPTRHPELTAGLSVHGLDKPTLRVTLGKGEQSATVNVGLTTLGGDRAVTFVTTGDAPTRPLAVKRSDLNGLFRDNARTKDGAAWELAKWLPDYRARRPLGGDLRSPETDAASIKVSTGGKELALTRGDSGWVFAQPAGWGPADDLGDPVPGPTAAPFTGVRPLLTALTSTSVGPDDYLDKPGDLNQYGLADSNADRVRVELAGKGADGKTGPADVLTLGKPVEKDGKPVTPTRVYAKYDADPAVFSMPFDRLDTLRATVNNPAPLRNRDLLAAPLRDKIDAIDLTVGGQTAKLRRITGEGGGKWWLFGGPAGPADVKPGDVETLLAVLTRPRLAREVLTTPNDPAFAGPEVKAVARFWTGSTPGKGEPGKPPAEPTTVGEPVTLTAGRVAGDALFVRKQAAGITTDVTVPAADVQTQMVRTRVSLLDPKVTPFDVTKATKLTVTRGAETVEATRDDKGNWTYAQPTARKGQVADGPQVLKLLGTLGGPTVTGVVSEAPSPDDLKKWGLEPPAATVTATLPDGPEKERKLTLGNPTDGGTVYARVGGSPLVLAVQKATADELTAADLRDRVLFRMEPGTVTRITLRGYKTDKGPEVYCFEKAGEATWKAVAPTPAGFTPDSQKLGFLLAALVAPRAEAFVGAGLKPEHGLDPAVSGEALEISLDRTAAPRLTLLLGAKAGDGLVFAATSALGQEVVTTRLTREVLPLAGRPANFQAPVPPPTPPAPITPPPPKK